MGVFDVSIDDITDGPISPTLVALALPLVVQNLVHVVNHVVDTFWLGRLDEAHVAAVGPNFPLVASLFGVTMTASVGTRILVAQRVGAGADAMARRVVVNGLGLAVVLGVGLVAVGGATVGGLGLGVHAVFWAVTGSNVLVAVFVGTFYLARHERLFADAVADVAEPTAD